MPPLNEAHGYYGVKLKDFNLNGRLSDHVSAGRFGARQMLELARVAECVPATRAAVPATVKCHIDVGVFLGLGAQRRAGAALHPCVRRMPRGWITRFSLYHGKRH